jgi:cytochrome c oxidase subunit II
MTTTLLILLSLFFLALIVYQIGKINEFTMKIKGEEAARQSITRANGQGMLIFLVVFLAGVVGSAYYYKNYMLGYGPHQSASEQGAWIDILFNVTLVPTGIVFVLTHIALFYFAWKYQERPGQKASFISHNNRLEQIWTGIPAVVMSVLVIFGLWVWNEAMSDVKPGEKFLEIEATGYQFAWAVRYPGADNKIGDKNFRLINSTNILGQDYTDKRNLDDMMPTGELYVPRGTKVRIRITARDVLHNFYIPNMRVKMDAIPGLPTYFVFTPTITTEEYRQQLSKYPEYQGPHDPADPNGPKVWEKFEYEIACAELCGKGHFSMRRVLRVVEPREYEAWLKTQKSFYEENIKGKEGDPYLAAPAASASDNRAIEFKGAIEKAMTDVSARTINLKNLKFETGSATLSADSEPELNNIIEAMKAHPTMKVEVAGHTDNVGDVAKNLTLSQQRAQAVVAYLTGKGIAADRMTGAGYGDSKPVADNKSEAGKAQNRRTELKITSI